MMEIKSTEQIFSIVLDLLLNSQGELFFFADINKVSVFKRKELTVAGLRN